MGDRLWTGKPFRYVTSQLGQLSLSSLRGRQIEYQPVRLGWRWRGHLCRVADNTVWSHDKWRPVVLRWISRRTIHSFTFTLYLSTEHALIHLWYPSNETPDECSSVGRTLSDTQPNQLFLYPLQERNFQSVTFCLMCLCILKNGKISGTSFMQYPTISNVQHKLKLFLTIKWWSLTYFDLVILTVLPDTFWLSRNNHHLDLALILKHILVECPDLQDTSSTSLFTLSRNFQIILFLLKATHI